MILGFDLEYRARGQIAQSYAPFSSSDWQMTRLIALSKFACGLKKSLLGAVFIDFLSPAKR